MTLRQLARMRRAMAESRRAAAVYFTAVLIALAVAATWVNGTALAYAGVFAYVLPVPFTWPVLDAVFARYAREPTASAPARSRLHWVVCVLAGVLLSLLIGALATS